MTSLEYLTSKKITPVIRIVAGSNKAEAFVTMTIEQFEEYGKHCVEKSTTPKEIEELSAACPECFKICAMDELKMFGGLCEDCSVDF